jgi:hypothetical protein
MTELHLIPTLAEETNFLGQQLFGKNIKKRTALTNRLLDICSRVQDKDFLLIHNPGGLGSTPLEGLLEWERSIVDGVVTTIERLGYSCPLVQYFRSDNTWWAHIRDTKEQARFLFKGQSQKIKEMAAELKFIAEHFSNLKILLIGVSQGAAFSNAVIRQTSELGRVYSIELGLFFPHMPRRVITERTLAIDNNGIIPDPIAHRNLRVSFKAYITAPSRWIKYRIEGKPQNFTRCINAPGHDYNWTYPEVRRQVEEFLEIKFGSKDKREAKLP